MSKNVGYIFVAYDRDGWDEGWKTSDVCKTKAEAVEEWENNHSGEHYEGYFIEVDTSIDEENTSIPFDNYLVIKAK